MRLLTGCVLAAGVLAVGGCSTRARAQSVEPKTFFSMQRTNFPPLPVLPFNDLPVYRVGRGKYVYDDRGLNYGQLQAAQRATAHPSTASLAVTAQADVSTKSVVAAPLANILPTNTLWVEIQPVSNGNVTLTIHAPDANPYDLFRTFGLVGNQVTNSVWRWVGRGTDGQSLNFPNARSQQAFYVLGSTVDTDGDSLTDAFEVLSSKTSPTTNHTYSASLSDKDWWLQSNVQVNDPDQDLLTDKNTQGSSRLVAFDDTVVVVWVDSNLGVTGYGEPGPAIYFPTNCSCLFSNCPVQTKPPEFVGWAVSHDGGVTFSDKGAPPLFTYVADGKTNMLGNAGDPELIRDTSSGTIYLLANPQRPSVYYPDGTNNLAKMYVPLWRSVDGGESFLPAVNVVPDLAASEIGLNLTDGARFAIDNFPGPGQGYLYSVVIWFNGSNPLVISRSTNGVNWEVVGEVSSHAGEPWLAVLPNHEICLTWRQESGDCGFKPMFIAKSSDYGVNWTTPVRAHCFNAENFLLPRFTPDDPNDRFRAAMVARFAANPITGDLYYVYHDQPDSTNASPNIYLIQSTNGGTSWSGPIQVNMEPTNSAPSDQWQPALAVKPDGTQLFIGWYDRRNDPINQCLIETYGTFAHLPITNASSFGPNFLISTAQFPPAFTGTNVIVGSYDPTYPPSLPPSDPGFCTSFDGAYRSYTGTDYQSAVSDENYVYYTWSDNRIWSTNQGISRPQGDIRFVRLAWPP